MPLLPSALLFEIDLVFHLSSDSIILTLLRCYSKLKVRLNKTRENFVPSPVRSTYSRNHAKQDLRGLKS